MSNDHQIATPPSGVKAELDRLELVECVPELTRQAARLIGFDLVLHLPHHPAVTAYINELAATRRPGADLKTARRNLKIARINYEKRVRYRVRGNICEWADGGLFVSLSAIIEARADAMHWRKVVMGHEHVARIKQQNRWAVARSRVTAI
jgi:hypothetical protein